MSDTHDIALFFRAYTGLEPQLVTDIRNSVRGVTRLMVWSVMTEQGHFYVVQGKQREVVRGLCAGGQGVAVVRAAAGTGTTVTLDAAREVWQASGHRVVGCALSARAALELEDSAGIPAVTIAAAKRSLETGMAVVGDDHLMAHVLEIGGQHLRDVVVVLDQQNAAGHSRADRNKEY